MKVQNQYLLRLLHGQTTSTIIHLNFWLELHPLGLFRSSLLEVQASGKFIIRNTGFYDLLESDYEVMADRGFQIQEDLLLHFCRLVVPLGHERKAR